MHLESRRAGKSNAMLERIAEVQRSAVTPVRVICTSMESAVRLRELWVQQFPKEIVPSFTVLPDEKREALNSIPPMTHELSSCWRQPEPAAIRLDDQHAYMSNATFEDLKEYSASIPTGAYEGKMWKRHNGAFDREFLAKGGQPSWQLCWYGYSELPNQVGIYRREIVVT